MLCHTVQGSGCVCWPTLSFDFWYKKKIVPWRQHRKPWMFTANLLNISKVWTEEKNQFIFYILSWQTLRRTFVSCYSLTFFFLIMTDFPAWQISRNLRLKNLTLLNNSFRPLWLLAWGWSDTTVSQVVPHTRPVVLLSLSIIDASAIFWHIHSFYIKILLNYKSKHFLLWDKKKGRYCNKTVSFASSRGPCPLLCKQNLFHVYTEQ